MTTLAAAPRRSHTHRFDAYTRWSLYLLFLAAPFLALAVLAPAHRGAPVAAAVYGIGMALFGPVACIRFLSEGITRANAGTPVPRRWMAAIAATAVALAAVGALLPPAEAFGGRTGAVAAALGTGAAALSAFLPARWIAAASLVAAAAAGLASLTEAGGDRSPLVVVAPVLAMVGGLSLSVRVSVWILGVVWQQERNAGIHARLAVAEERLRFSRDLHDVVGRALSAIAVKSELAAELSRRGQPGAEAQMAEVRRLAQDTLREARAVVAGYRAVDLRAELEGARSVLRSAGVETTAAVSEAALPDTVQQAMGWVVREAVTNVLRHADATRTDIRLAVTDGAVTLVVRNDGAGDAGTRRSGAGGGTGLIGLAERLEPLGGTLTPAQQDGWFTLTARVPRDETRETT